MQEQEYNAMQADPAVVLRRMYEDGELDNDEDFSMFDPARYPDIKELDEYKKNYKKRKEECKNGG